MSTGDFIGFVIALSGVGFLVLLARAAGLSGNAGCMGKWLALIIVLCLLAAFVLNSSADEPELEPVAFLPLVAQYRGSLLNGAFEADKWREARHWLWPWHEAYANQYDEIRSAEHWTAWWVEERFCPRYEPFKTGRPEVRVITTIPDPLRVQAGKQALKWFTFWRCHYGGVYQRVENLPDGLYQASIYAHHAYTDCSSRMHEPPLHDDCVTAYNAQAYFSIGMDTSGGKDYWAYNIAWSVPIQTYGRYTGVPFYGPIVEVTDGVLTLWVRSITTAPLKHNDFYLDSVNLERLSK